MTRTVPFAAARRAAPTLVFAIAVAAAALASACSRTVAGPDPVRGEYLVQRVGLCIDCHSPRDAQGRALADQDLCGAPIPMQPTVPMPWSPVAPRIAGLPTLTDAEAVHFLRTGELPGGRRPQPPMPPYRMDERDARDVVAYLRALPAPQAQ